MSGNNRKIFHNSNFSNYQQRNCKTNHVKKLLAQMNDIYDFQQTLSQAPKQISRKYYI